MPIFFKKILADGSMFGLWQIGEDENFFLENLDLNAAETAELTPIRGNRRLEWLAARLLLHEMPVSRSSASGVSGTRSGASGHRHFIEKAPSGQPFWPARPDVFFSISHSGGLVAALISDKKCGIDWQVFTDKISRIRSKFLNETELEQAENSAEPDFLNIAWGAKESLFKAWGAGEIDFRKHLRLDFSTNSGWVEKGETRLAFDVFHEKWTVGEADFMLVWVLEKDGLA